VTAHLPPVFIGHGSPTTAIRDTAAHRFHQAFGRDYETRHGRPKALLVVSPHWMTRVPAVSGAAQPVTVHDFGGFPDALYRLRYAAPGAPDVARRVAELVPGTVVVPDQGLDHGAWMPLLLAWPEADIPVSQLAIQPHAGPSHHYRLGQALAPLAEEGVLVFASGNVSHNLRDAMRNFDREDVAPPAWGAAFDTWLDEKLAEGDVPALLDYRRQAPGADQAQPQDDHLLPIYVALGAAGPRARGHRLHRSWDYGSISMSSWELLPA
jgi:4,5-DOPA dioxygenase extradiol